METYWGANVFEWALRALWLVLGITFVWCLISIRALVSRQRRNRSPIRAFGGPVAFAVALGVFITLGPTLVDVGLNVVHRVPSPAISSRAHELHRQAFVVDMHADTLLWPKRDFFRRNEWSHVDLPRLQEGNVALQMFTIVTSVPYGMTFESNNAPTHTMLDKLTPKVAIEGWGWEALTTNAGRVLFQTQHMHELVRDSNNMLHLIRTREDMASFVQQRDQLQQQHQHQQRLPVAAVLGIEGLHALDGNLTNVDRFFDAGVRMMGLTHFFDNDLAGSAHGRIKAGLTPFGRQVVARLEQKKIFIDVAHASEEAIHELLEVATRPVVSSHTGVRGVCNNQRNLDDASLRGIARTGGVVGVAYFSPAICGSGGDEDDNDVLLEGIIKTITYVRDLIGIQHVALGSDFDGTVVTPFDTSQLVQITNGLLQAGFTHDDVLSVLGGNMRRLLLDFLP